MHEDDGIAVSCCDGPMRIILLCRSLEVGGAERQIVELAKGLSRRGHEVSVAVFYDGGPLTSELDRAGIRIHALRKAGRWDVLGFWLRLVKLVRRERPDIVHSYLTVPNLLAASIRPLLPRCAIVWGIRASRIDARHYNWLFDWVERIAVRLSKHADRIIVNSHAGFGDHRQMGYPVSVMRVVENGIDTDRFVPDRPRGLELRERWGVLPNETLIGVVGRLDPMKGHRTFFEAASPIAEDRPEVRFVCVGSGNPAFAEVLRDAAGRSLGARIIWQDVMSDPTPAYNALDGLCSASEFGEGFSNVIAEAMSCGVPCVATDIGDSARIVGHPGYIAAPADACSLRRALVALLDDLRMQNVDRTALRRRIVESYSLERLVLRTEEILSEALRLRQERGSR